MTVNISKPAVNVREKLAELDKPTGIAGEAMLRAETPQEQFNLIGAGRRNLLINNDFRIWQRGTTHNGGASNWSYTTDRWQAGYTATTEKITGGLKMTIGSNTTGNQLFQIIENVDDEFQRNFDTYTATIKFKAPVGVTAQIYVKNWGNGWADLFSGSVEATGEVQTLSVTGSSANLATNTNPYFNLLFAGATTGQIIEVYNTQLEGGKVATPFEHRSYGEELALCQRYFQRFSYNQYNYFGIAVAPTGVSTVLTDPKAFIVPMRAGPTGSVARTGGSPVLVNIGAGTYNITSLAVNTFGGNSHWWVQGTSSLPTRESDFYEIGGSGITTFDLDAEL